MAERLSTDRSYYDTTIRAYEEGLKQKILESEEYRGRSQIALQEQETETEALEAMKEAAKKHRRK